MLRPGLFAHRAGYNGLDIGIPLVGNDAFGIVLHLLLTVLDMLVDMSHLVCGQGQLLLHLLIPFKQLDRIPAQKARFYLVLDGLFDMRQSVLYTAGEYMGMLAGMFFPRGFRGQLCSLHAALPFQGADGHRFAAQGLAQLFQVDLVTAAAYQVHHVHSQHHRDAQLQQLGGQVEVALDVGAVQDVQDSVRLFIDQIIAGDDFFQRVG